MKRMNFPNRKMQRQKDADIRQAEADERSLEEQLAKLDAEGHNAVWERAKLLLKIDKRDLAAKPEKKAKKPRRKSKT